MFKPGVGWEMGWKGEGGLTKTKMYEKATEKLTTE